MKHMLLTISLIFGATTDAATIKVIDKAWLFTKIWVNPDDPVFNKETEVALIARAYKTEAHCLLNLENAFMSLKDRDDIKIMKNKPSYKQLLDGERVYKLECHLIGVFE